MKKTICIYIVLLSLVLSIVVSGCNTPTESKENPAEIGK